jgi:hypothetical protein
MSQKAENYSQAVHGLTLFNGPAGNPDTKSRTICGMYAEFLAGGIRGWPFAGGLVYSVRFAGS